MYPHRIRLRGPWECEPLVLRSAPDEGDPAPLPPPRRMAVPCRWAEGGLVEFTGRVRFRRRFGYPGRLDPPERVWLTFAGVDERTTAWLNGTPLGEHHGNDPFEFEVTPLLRPRNELVLEVEGTTERGGVWGEVSLEVRCTAYLRDVRLWAVAAEDDTFQLHAAGRAVGTADGPLDLYVLYGRSTVAYAILVPTPEGQPFHLTTDKLSREQSPGEEGEKGQGEVVKVDLVNGPTVWYTVEREVVFEPTCPGG